MTIGISTLGEKKGHVRIRVREDSSAGISLGNGVDVMPGETADVPHGIAVGMLATGRAELVTVKTPDPAAPKTPETKSPKTGDPKPSTPETGSEPKTPATPTPTTRELALPVDFAELRTLAKTHGVDLTKHRTKAAVTAALVDALKAQGITAKVAE